MQAKLIDAVSLELERAPASRECDDFDTKGTAAVKAYVTPEVLPRLALSCPTQSIVKGRTLKVIKSIEKHVNSHLFSALAAILALLSLESETLRLIAVGTPLDTLLEIVFLFSLVVFGVELLVRCVAEEGYCLTAWFPLDLLATVSLLMELRWFQELAFKEDCTMFSPSHDHVAHVGGQGAHALRVARVARGLRILRFARMIKLCRLMAGLPVCSEVVVPKAQRKLWLLVDKIKKTDCPVAEELVLV